MELRFHAHFVRGYADLTADEQRQVDSALQRLIEDPRHPGLRARKWDTETWYARASRDLRFFYEIGDGFYLLLDVGHHDIERSH